MKAAVRYYTKTGNTKRLAEAVAKAIGAEALPISAPVTEPVAILFLGRFKIKKISGGALYLLVLIGFVEFLMLLFFKFFVFKK